MSTDEITDIQALERLHEAFASISGEIKQRSVDYIRHGPPSLIANFKVASDLDISGASSSITSASINRNRWWHWSPTCVTWTNTW